MGRVRQRLGTNELLRIDLREPNLRGNLRGVSGPGALRVTANGIEAMVRLKFTPCRFGGQRPWLICDGCGNGRLVLYAREFVYRYMRGGKLERETRKHSWRCRKCWHLTYLSQRASRNGVYTAQLRIEALVGKFVPG
jgi:hypothetical protein